MAEQLQNNASRGDPGGRLDGMRYYKDSALDNDVAHLQTDQSWAVDEAAQLVPSNSDDPEFAPRLKTLVTLLLGRYRRSGGIGDLQQAVIRAEEMMIATPLSHPERSDRIHDWIHMMLAKGSCEGYNEDDLQYVIEVARQVDLTVEVTRIPRGRSSAIQHSEVRWETPKAHRSFSTHENHRDLTRYIYSRFSHITALLLEMSS